MLIQKGAGLITKSDDILNALGISKEELKQKKIDFDLSADEKKVKKILTTPIPKDELIRKLGKTTSEANVLLASLELKGLIKESLGLISWDK
jgi:predicted Rossmann fold nucleotide-binding protein DprA/Smf involved in DNA uptake